MMKFGLSNPVVFDSRATCVRGFYPVFANVNLGDSASPLFAAVMSTVTIAATM